MPTCILPKGSNFLHTSLDYCAQWKYWTNAFPPESDYEQLGEYHSEMVPGQKVIRAVMWMDILAISEGDCNCSGLVNGKKTCLCGWPEKFLKGPVVHEYLLWWCKDCPPLQRNLWTILISSMPVFIQPDFYLFFFSSKMCQCMWYSPLSVVGELVTLIE